MFGTLKPYIVRSFESTFVDHCLDLIGEAFLNLKEKHIINVEWEEENISANFYNFIDQSKKAISLNINISDEHRLYYESILSGKNVAKKAARIDFRITTNYIEKGIRLEYFIEAKNLIEIDCLKESRKTKIKAQEKHERYIRTGIDHFISGKYPQKGCLVGYVLQGNPDSIVEKINKRLQNEDRFSELLQKNKKSIIGLDFCYKSEHANNITLQHFLLDFSI